MSDRNDLVAALRRFAGAASPLVICDYDGTLAPIVDEPDQAFPLDESVGALRALASLDGTHVAVVSGRSLRDLVALCPFPPGIHLVGSHGSEFDGDFENDLESTELELLERITGELRRLAAGGDGLIVETKPASVAFHYRQAAPELAEQALAAVRAGPATEAGVRVKEGKKVIELVVIDADKGTAVERLRRQLGGNVVLFVGDDVTDEDVFAVLHDDDIGIKVGDGPTLARYRVDAPADTARLLMLLCELRQAWLNAQQPG